MRLYLAVLGGSVLLGATILWLWGGKVEDPYVGGAHDYGSFVIALRDCAFNFASAMTCTGYATANFQCWPSPLLLMFLALMFVGGCTGSTSGGIKVYRLLIVGRLVMQKVRAFIGPRTVELIKLNGTVLDHRELSGIVFIVLIFLFASLIGAFLLAFDPRIDVLSAFSAAVTAISCIVLD